jgi:hypothetical protein
MRSKAIEETVEKLNPGRYNPLVTSVSRKALYSWKRIYKSERIMADWFVSKTCGERLMGCCHKFAIHVRDTRRAAI